MSEYLPSDEIRPTSMDGMYQAYLPQFKQITDLSATFDTIDNQILLSLLSSCFGLSNTALNLIASYLFN